MTTSMTTVRHGTFLHPLLGEVDATLRTTKYVDGSLALVMTEGPTDDVVSVNLGAYGIIPTPGHFFVKDYAEGQGLAAAMAEAGLLELTGRVEHFGPFDASAVEARLADGAGLR